jgi:adenosylcobinamide-GDP ribazoletransferase
VLASFKLAAGFLTRIPVRTGVATPQQLGAAVGWFPWIGGGLGLCALAWHWLLVQGWSSSLIGVWLVAFAALATGGLHLDGVADVFDAAGGGRGSRARMLEIMRDPRIGAHGASALALCLLAKVLGSAEIVAEGPISALVVAPVWARFGAVCLIKSFPYARPEGLGRSFHDHAQARHVGLAGLAAALVLLWAGAELIVPALCALAVSYLLGLWAQHRIGGLTGDVYGAAIELAELSVLFAARWTL